MPKYIYRCKKCEKTLEVVHSIKEELTDCEECKLKGTLQRVPSMPFVISKKNKKQKPGALVKKHIEEARQEMEKEKEKLKKAGYKE